MLENTCVKSIQSKAICPLTILNGLVPSQPIAKEVTWSCQESWQPLVISLAQDHLLLLVTNKRMLTRSTQPLLGSSWAKVNPFTGKISTEISQISAQIKTMHVSTVY